MSLPTWIRNPSVRGRSAKSPGRHERRRRIASFAVLVGCMFVGAACNRSMSREAYCEQRQAAWERAFPDEPQTDEQRRTFVDSCIELGREERNTVLYTCRLSCFETHIKNGDDPRQEYLDMVACERDCL